MRCGGAGVLRLQQGRLQGAGDTQSLRSGGDTFLHAQGLTAEERRDVGQWATPLVERGYLRRTLREKLTFMRAAGL